MDSSRKHDPVYRKQLARFAEKFTQAPPPSAARQKKAAATPPKYRQTAAPPPPAASAPPTTQTEAEIARILSAFDGEHSFGPCLGITRLQRWERARAFGDNPPEKVRDILIADLETNIPPKHQQSSINSYG